MAKAWVTPHSCDPRQACSLLKSSRYLSAYSIRKMICLMLAREETSKAMLWLSIAAGVCWMNKPTGVIRGGTG